MKIETKTKELWKLRSLKKWDNRPWIVFRNDICSPLVKISELLVGDFAVGDQRFIGLYFKLNFQKIGLTNQIKTFAHLCQARYNFNI